VGNSIELPTSIYIERRETMYLMIGLVALKVLADLFKEEVK
jgi:hypothetical protein